MPKTLFLTQARAARNYQCQACLRLIQRGEEYFRHEPFPFDRVRGLEERTHWCMTCILGASSLKDQKGRIWIRPSAVLQAAAATRPADGAGVQLELIHAEVVGVSTLLAEQLARSPEQIHMISPAQFQDFICDRLWAMGFEPKQVGGTYSKDGGIDVVFWPRSNGAFPFLGVAQCKHHRDPNRKEGPASVRDFAGAIAGHPFNAALLVTNTSFSPDAEWFARERAKLIRLRGFSDIQRWLLSDFSGSAEWREIPASIELCPGVVVRLR